MEDNILSPITFLSDIAFATIPFTGVVTDEEENEEMVIIEQSEYSEVI